MPTPIPGAPVFHPTITLPVGADPPTLETIATPLEELADRTRHIVQHFAYAGENPRQITFSPTGGSSGLLCYDTSTLLLAPVTLDDGWRVYDDPTTGLTKGYFRCKKFGTGYLLDISAHLRSGMVLTSLTAWVDPGSTQISPTDRMAVSVSYTIPDTGAEAFINSATSDATAAPQGIVVSLAGHVANKINRQYLVRVLSSQGADVGTEDILRGFSLSFSEPAGMGPRNY